MIKRILFALKILLLASYSMAQQDIDSTRKSYQKFCVKVGVGSSYDVFFNSKHLGFDFCADINYHLGKHFSLETGFDLYDFISHESWTEYDPRTNHRYINNYSSNEQYVSMPFNIYYHLTHPNRGFYVGIGINFSYPFREFDHGDGYNVYDRYYYNYTRTYSPNFINALELGGTLKIGYSFHLINNISGFIETGAMGVSDHGYLFFNVGGSYSFGKIIPSSNKINSSSPKINSDVEKKKPSIVHLMNPPNVFFFGGAGISGNIGTNHFETIPSIPRNDSINTTITTTKSKEKPGACFSFGLNVDVLRIGKIYINAGLEIHNINYQGTALEYYRTSSYNYKQYTTTTFYSTPFNYFYNEWYWFFPVTVKYPLKENKKLFFGIQTGIAPCASFYESLSGAKYSRSSAGDGGDFFLPIGLIYDKLLTKTFECFIEPEFLFQPFKQNDGRSFYSFTLKAGIVLW